jgi:hypothetical protein
MSPRRPARRPLRRPAAPSLPALALLSAVSLLAVAPRAEAATPLDVVRLKRGHDAIMQLDVAEAHAALDGASPDDPMVATELALLAVYEGDCDRAVALLKRHASSGKHGAAALGEIARGCARVTASTEWYKDDERGVHIRFKDEDDRALAPFLTEVAAQAMAALERDLGVRLPRPLRIELVRDQYSLAAMTGLPEEAAQTTGTVAVAKWGRVTMLSPRASTHGFPWADTLMHELTHLSVTRASRDRAPLWLQEGTAKRQETRWRSPGPFDDLPSPDAMAKLGFERGLALPLDRLGPSIAMLPTPEQAMIAFAEVHSFIRYWSKEAGEGALARLLFGLADAPDEDPVNATLVKVSGTPLAAWSERWQQSLNSSTAVIPPDLMPSLPHAPSAGHAGEPPQTNVEKPSPPPDPAARDIYRNARLGELLVERKFNEQASRYFRKTVAAAPYDPSARARLAMTLRAMGREEEAWGVVASIEAVHSAHGLYLAVRGAAQRGRGDASAAEESFRDARLVSPLDPQVACQGLAEGRSPDRPAEAALCELARRR